MNQQNLWPAFPVEGWTGTLNALHLWMQIAGKVRMARAPMTNHWWQVPLYVAPRGMTTSPIPCNTGMFQIDFDFIDHELRIQKSDGQHAHIPLREMPVSTFYGEVMETLRKLDLTTRIWPVTVELQENIRLDLDDQPRTYSPEHAHRFWQILVQADRVLKIFRSRFMGKASPVHFFWGSFDLTVTRFSGRSAPPHPGVPGIPNHVTVESYSHQQASCGFWPGNGGADDAAFYAYAYPEPEGYKDHPIQPVQAFYSETLREFILPYNTVRESPNPDQTLLDFLQSTYEVAANLGEWDRESLERQPGQKDYTLI